MRTFTEPAIVAFISGAVQAGIDEVRIEPEAVVLVALHGERSLTFTISAIEITYRVGSPAKHGSDTVETMRREMFREIP